MTQLTKLPPGNAELIKIRIGEMDIDKLKSNYEKFIYLKKNILKQGIHYGLIPGTQKPTLFKPGAEALLVIFSLSTSIEETNRDVNMESGFVDFEYKVQVRNIDGTPIADGVGSCNSFEDKYYYSAWTPAEKPPESDQHFLKKKGVGGFRKNYKNGKIEWHQREQKPCEHLIALKNTIQKMAKKRAFIDAVLNATGGSEFFTQDIEDLEILPDTAAVLGELRSIVKIAIENVTGRKQLTAIYKACTVLHKEEGIHNLFAEKSKEFPETKQ